MIFLFARCEPEYFGFPDCQACSCPSTAKCDEVTGECICAPFVTGTAVKFDRLKLRISTILIVRMLRAQCVRKTRTATMQSRDVRNAVVALREQMATCLAGLRATKTTPKVSLSSKSYIFPPSVWTLGSAIVLTEWKVVSATTVCGAPPAI